MSKGSCVGFFNQFQVNILNLYSLKTPENQSFQEVWKWNIRLKWVKIFFLLKIYKSDNWLFTEFHNILESAFPLFLALLKNSHKLR